MAQYPLYRRLVENQSRSGQVRKISALPAFDPWTVKLLAQPLYRLSYPGPLDYHGVTYVKERFCYCSSSLAKLWPYVSLHHWLWRNNRWYTVNGGARGGADGWGTALKTGRSRVRYNGHLIHLIISASVWPWESTQRLTKVSTRNVCWG
jgi:hypothetical protein